MIAETTHYAACRVLDARVEFHPQQLVTPLVLSTGSIEEVVEARAEATVEVGGVRAIGRGSIYLSDLWAWPSAGVPHESRVTELQRLTEQTARELPRLVEARSVHPLEFGLRLHDWICHEADNPRHAPLLALAMCGSPFDAAVHDAVGIALERSSFALFDGVTPLSGADEYFPELGTLAAVRRLLRPPRRELPAWWIVNKADPLPETLERAFQRGGYRCFKLKITGSDTEADVARTSAVYRAARATGIGNPVLTIDSNEANPHAASVLDYLERLEALDHDAYDALQYVEQPTGRDIERHAFEWQAVAKRKPVLLDEGLTDLSVLPTARRQGWSGLALKTCKGHSMLLVAAAWAAREGMVLALQDLTNPGRSLIHAALVGACLPTINGVELNSPQFTPAANAEFLPRLSGLFEPSAGVHRLPTTLPIGLGSQL